jgi:hypothetical protein
VIKLAGAFAEVGYTPLPATVTTFVKIAAAAHVGSDGGYSVKVIVPVGLNPLPDRPRPQAL